MEKVQIFGDPAGFVPGSPDTIEISGVPFYKDTPCVRTATCMLCTAPPVIHSPGNTSPSNRHRRPQALDGWIEQGLAPTHDDVAACLFPIL